MLTGMNQTDDINSLRRFYGQGIHLYTQGLIYQGWLLIPVDWGENSYTISCLSPSGTQYIEWYNYRSLEDAIAAGRDLVESLIKEMTSFKIRPI
ncbi:MAG: hypothetical protein WBV73_12135 [Phormidium sp.]